MTQFVDPSALRKAFSSSLNTYNPFRRTSRHGDAINPRDDSFWMIIDGGIRLGLFTDEFPQKFDPNNTFIEAWADAKSLPDIDRAEK